MKPKHARIAILLALAFLPMAWAQHFGPWSPRVNIGPPVNTQQLENNPFISKDGLSLYFTRLECETCSSGPPQDIWVSHRETVDSAWGVPEKLPNTINSVYVENTASSTIDGHYLFFISNRPGGCGKQDIYMSRRQNKKVDSGEGGWELAVNLGCTINSTAREQGPVLFEDETTGKITMYFNSQRVGNRDDIYSSELQPDGTWSLPQPVTELNSPADDSMPVLSRDGLEIYFVSTRPGSIIDPDGVPSADIWMSTRASTSERWSEPQNVTALNSLNWEGRPALSFDGTAIYFNTVHTAEECEVRHQCNMSTAWDIWMATREKLTGQVKK